LALKRKKRTESKISHGACHTVKTAGIQIESMENSKLYLYFSLFFYYHQATINIGARQYDRMLGRGAARRQFRNTTAMTNA
jgi:hypothetical protein